jgi:predicted Zn-dependent protease
MKTVKVILAVALASQLLLACSSNTNSNANTTNTNTKTTSTTTTANTSNANTTSKANSNSETSTPQDSTASGDNHYTHKEGGIQFDLPAGWKAEPNGDQMTLSTADGSLSVVIYVASEDNFKEATEALDKELSKTIKNVKESGEPKETKVGGMQTVSQSGTGEVNGTEIQWAVDLIQAKKPVIVLSFAAPGVWEKHQGEYQQFGKSIKPIS